MAHILIVDDEDDILKVIQITLESRGHTVTAKSDGYQALEALEKIKPDLIILDVMMPGISGIDVAEKIRKNEELCHIPIFMLTAVTENSTQSDSYWRDRMKVADFLSKPFEILELLSRVDNLLKT